MIENSKLSSAVSTFIYKCRGARGKLPPTLLLDGPGCVNIALINALTKINVVRSCVKKINASTALVLSSVGCFVVIGTFVVLTEWLRPLRPAQSTSTTTTSTRANCHSAATNSPDSDERTDCEPWTITHSSSPSTSRWPTTSSVHYRTAQTKLLIGHTRSARNRDPCSVAS